VTTCRCGRAATVRGMCPRCYQRDWHARHPHARAAYNTAHRDRMRAVREEARRVGVPQLASYTAATSRTPEEIKAGQVARALARRRERMASDPAYAERQRAYKRAYDRRRRASRPPRPRRVPRAVLDEQQRRTRETQALVRQLVRALTESERREHEREHRRARYASDPEYRARRTAYQREYSRARYASDPTFRATHARQERERRARRRAERRPTTTGGSK